jgi:hypothetical protein
LLSKKTKCRIAIEVPAETVPLCSLLRIKAIFVSDPD